MNKIFFLLAVVGMVGFAAVAAPAQEAIAETHEHAVEVSVEISQTEIPQEVLAEIARQLDEIEIEVQRLSLLVQKVTLERQALALERQMAEGIAMAEAEQALEQASPVAKEPAAGQAEAIAVAQEPQQEDTAPAQDVEESVFAFGEQAGQDEEDDQGGIAAVLGGQANGLTAPLRNLGAAEMVALAILAALGVFILFRKLRGQKKQAPSKSSMPKVDERPQEMKEGVAWK